MRVKGAQSPPGAFTVEERPDRPGFAAVRFYENARPYHETRDGAPEDGWEYDEYRLTIALYNGLEADIESNYAVYLEQAKSEDCSGPTELEKLRADVDFLAVMGGIDL